MPILDCLKTRSYCACLIVLFKTLRHVHMLDCQCNTFAVIDGNVLATSYYCIVRFIRNFSLPFLLLGDVLRGHLQHGQIYPS